MARRKRNSAALLGLNDAVREVHRKPNTCCPNRPIPQLGLARLYVYGLKDIDRAYAASEGGRTARLPHGEPREVAARRWLPRARRPTWSGLPQRQGPAAGEGPDQRAKERLRTAMELYQASVPYASANVSIVKVQAACTR